MKQLLIGSPIRRSPKILKAFLDNIDRIDFNGFDVYYYFIDDNDNDESSKLLADFSSEHRHTIIKRSVDIMVASATKYEEFGTRNWNTELTDRVAELKDIIINYARKKNFDYLLFVDSDMVLQSKTIQHLSSLDVDIVSEIFWTDWHRSGVATPSLWMEDENSIIKKQDLSGKDKFYARRTITNFYAKLRSPGTYRVGGLGALTLINKTAIKKPISFQRIDNVSFFGEDRHFCIRARALGLNLFVDTYYPAFHIFREELLKTLPNFLKYGYREKDILIPYGADQPNARSKNSIKKWLKIHYKNLKGLRLFVGTKLFSKKRIIKNSDQHKLTLMMIVRNESGRFLEETISAIKPCLSNVVILDDNSDDDTVEICERCLKGVPHKIIKNKESNFAKEYIARELLWKETIKTNPEWIICLDADEVLEEKAVKIIPELLKNPVADAYSFPLYDMWDETHYRDDRYWHAHNSFMPTMLRFQPKYRYSRFLHTNQHCGRFPKNAFDFIINCDYPLRIKHLGWLRDEDKQRKYERYMELDPEGKYGSIEQYQSILDDRPHLVKFVEGGVIN